MWRALLRYCVLTDTNIIPETIWLTSRDKKREYVETLISYRTFLMIFSQCACATLLLSAWLVFSFFYPILLCIDDETKCDICSWILCILLSRILVLVNFIGCNNPINRTSLCSCHWEQNEGEDEKKSTAVPLSGIPARHRLWHVLTLKNAPTPSLFNAINKGGQLFQVPGTSCLARSVLPRNASCSPPSSIILAMALESVPTYLSDLGSHQAARAQQQRIRYASS